MEAKRLLVVGSPRSGTKFCASFLQDLGLRVNHERMGEDGTVNGAWLAPRTEGDTFLQPPCGREGYTFDKIIHLVRHPLKTIHSLSVEMHDFYPFWEWQEKFSNLKVNDRDDLELVAAFWLFWTDGCARLADSTIRLEDISRGRPALNMGAPRSTLLEWPNLGAMELPVREAAKRYDYG